jgi:hypothetical protein
MVGTMLISRLNLSALLVVVGSAQAALAPGVVPDPVIQAWFGSLRQPTSRALCCSISDCHFTAYKERGGHFEVIVGGWPYTVPDTAIIRDNPSPTGQAVVCYDYVNFGPPLAPGERRTAPQDEIEILCFLPSQPQS